MYIKIVIKEYIIKEITYNICEQNEEISLIFFFSFFMMGFIIQSKNNSHK